MDALSKIKSIKEIAKIVEGVKQNHRKVVHCHGEFDLIHLGHMRYFKKAAEMGDFLIVTLTPDRFIEKGPGRPVFNETFRAEAISYLEFVNCVGINENPTAAEILKIVQPDIYVKGSEYLNKVDVTGRLEMEKKLVESFGGKMAFTHEIIFSSSKLLNRYFDIFTKKSLPFLQYMAEKYDAINIINSLDKLNPLKVLIIKETETDLKSLSEFCNNLGMHKLETVSLCLIENQTLEFISDKIDDFDCVVAIDEGMGLFTKQISSFLSQRSKYLAVFLPIEHTHTASFFKFYNIDFLGFNQGNSDNYINNDGHYLPANQILSNIQFRDQSQENVVIIHSDGLSVKEDDGFKNYPGFIDKKEKSHSQADAGSFVFSVLATMKCLDINSDWLKLTGNALLSMIDKNSETHFELKRLSLDKFIIALLNR
jgi:rfaE bifunctional protein nucleotidyltransferase chain/domain